MAQERFHKYEAFVAGCFLAGVCKNQDSRPENEFIYNEVMLGGEKLAFKVSHGAFFKKWNYFLAAGGLERIGKEVVISLKKCSPYFVDKVVSYIEIISAANGQNGEAHAEGNRLINKLFTELDGGRQKIRA